MTNQHMKIRFVIRTLIFSFCYVAFMYFTNESLAGTLAFWQSSQAPVVQLAGGLGPSPSNNLTLRSLTFNGPYVVSYKAVNISSGTCTDLGMDSAIEAASEFSIATPFSFFPTNNTTNYICAIGKNSAGIWQDSSDPTIIPLVIDTVLPVLTATSFHINSDAAATTNNYVSIALQGTDDVSGIVKFCFKSNNTTAPVASDSCFIPVSILGGAPGASVTLSNAPYLLGFTQNTYSVYAWALDLAGNISALTNSGAGTIFQDKEDITYNPPQPAVLLNITATNDDTSTNTPTMAQTNFTTGQAVVIKWNASAPNGLNPLPISLDYSTDETNYTSIAGNIANSANAGCTVDGVIFTGCYVWTSPGAPNGYFRVRVTVQDSIGLVSLTSNAGANGGNFQAIAGNTDLGLGGDARTTIFKSYKQHELQNGDALSLVVTSTGTIYFKDDLRGILKVSPTDGLQKLFIPKTGAYSGDGGNAENATLVGDPFQIALDYQDRLLIYDKDRILRVDSDGKIRTVIGGGGSTSENSLALDYQIPAQSTNEAYRRAMTFFTAPNGDIYFTDQDPAGRPVDGGPKLKWLSVADGRIHFLSFSGTGDSVSASTDITLLKMQAFGIRFDPNTHARLNLIASMYEVIPGSRIMHSVSFDVNTGVSLGAGPHAPTVTNYRLRFVYSPAGDLYIFNPTYDWVQKYNPGTNTWTRILGLATNQGGHCPDGTLATSCPIQISDLFVDKSNQIYFVDNGVIRAISGGNVITLFGQALSSGEGLNPLAARFPTLDFIDRSQSDKVVISDHIGGYLWEFGRTGNLSRLAGNGLIARPNSGTTAMSSPYLGNYGDYARGLIVNLATNEIYANGTHSGCPNIVKLNRTTGNWENMTVGCGLDFWLADGTNSAKATNYHWYFVGFDGTQLLTSNFHWNGTTTEQSYMKFYNSSTGVQSHFAGNITYSDTFPADGTDMSTNGGFPHYSFTRAYWDATNTRWIMSTSGGIRIVSIPMAGAVAGNISTLTTTVRISLAYTYRLESGNQILYYCASDGKIYRRNITLASEAALTWPSSTIKCKGRAMNLNTNLNMLEFIFEQNGLYGIGQYDIGPP